MAYQLLLELLPAMPPLILIVEDDTATRQSLRTILEQEGVEVHEAPDGERAIGALARFHYDAIILDIALPRMSGTDVMEYIASTTPEILTSVVVVTGLEMHEVRNLFPQISETLSKPVSPSRLLASLRRCLPPSRTAGTFVA